MHSFGCFGSSLAFIEDGENCTSCPHRVECGALVQARMPQWLRVLDAIRDMSGESMKSEWMKPEDIAAEKKRAKDMKAQAAASRAYGSVADLDRVKSLHKKNTHSLIDQLALAGVNVERDSVDVLSKADKKMATIVALLRTRPHSMKELAAEVAAKHHLTDASAQRMTYARISILFISKRVKRAAGNVELI
jgi:hypothetical protein